MRLIDADRFIRWIDAVHLRNIAEKCFSEKDVVNMINMQPTEFDVDKVVEQLNELNDNEITLANITAIVNQKW